jgi:hypothetical protein
MADVAEKIQEEKVHGKCGSAYKYVSEHLDEYVVCRLAEKSVYQF